MKRWILLLFAAAACLAASVCPVSASDTASAGYSITEYDMDVAVHENNVYTVTETIGRTVPGRAGRPAWDIPKHTRRNDPQAYDWRSAG